MLDTGDLPWVQLAQPGSAVHHIPGNHITMNFMPHVQVMGDKITQILSTLGLSLIHISGEEAAR